VGLNDSDPLREDLYFDVVEYCRLLRANGVRATTSETLDAMEALGNVDLLDPQDFRLALRTTLATSVEDLEIFDRLFESYWRSGSSGIDEPGEDQEVDDKNRNGTSSPNKRMLRHLQPEEDQVEAGEHQEASYSPLESLREKDFSTFQPDDTAAFARVVAQIGRRLATRQSSRTHRSRRGSVVDLRRTLRRNLSYGGTILQLEHERRKILKPRLVLLCDVSRSMDEYARFLLHFVYAFQNAFSHVEVFVFGTQLTRVSGYLRTSDILSAIERISRRVPDWSGGTRIGESIQTFNGTFAPSLLDRRTVTIILSDGLDTGDTEVLEKAIRALRRRTRRFVWLNPLLSNPDYRPLARGMNAVLPYVDALAPAHNLASLQRLEQHMKL
jgi:uncharacterized protein with von Willebrand factor type A (vWA) domain